MPEPAPESLGMDAFERFLFLRTIPVLSALPADVVRVVAAHTRQAIYPDGSFVYRQGQPATHVHYIVDGSIEIRRNGQPVRTLVKTEVAGGISAMAGDDQGYDGVAVGDTVTLRIASDDTQEILEDHFVLLRGILEGTGREVLRALRQLGPNAGFETSASEVPYYERALDLVEKMAFLRQSVVLQQSHIDAVSDLAQEVEEKRFEAGTELWLPGAASPYFLLLVSGSVECDAEDPVQHFVLGPGDSVGANEATAGEPRWFRARAREDVVALKIDVETFYDILEDHFDMALALLRSVMAGIMRLYDLKADAAAQSSPSLTSASDRG
ncbi:MAG: cyclic nucleotide-binding domain-containing protein [Myxococcota bacterium]